MPRGPIQAMMFDLVFLVPKDRFAVSPPFNGRGMTSTNIHPELMHHAMTPGCDTNL